MDTRILVRLHSYSRQQIKDIDGLDRCVKDLIVAVSQGHTTVEQLLAKQRIDIQEHIDQNFDKQAQAERRLRLQEKLKGSLFFPEIFAREEDIHEIHEGTCQWIFENSQSRVEDGGDRQWPSFPEWLDQGQGVYLFSGKPGSGKSTLMRYLSLELPSRIQSRRLQLGWTCISDLVATGFFFWGLGTALQKNHLGFLRSLLYQVADQRPDIVRVLLDDDVALPNEFSNSATLQLLTWTEKRLLCALKKLIVSRAASTCFLFCIDGLDEFEGDEDKLMDTIRVLSNMSNTRVFVSSRPNQIVRHSLLDGPYLRLQDLNHKDLQQAANDKLQPALGSHFSENKKQIGELINDLVLKAEGVFLWLDLVVKIIKNGARSGDTLNELFETLDTMPNTIEGMYERMWSQLDARYQQEAIRYFRIMIVFLHSLPSIPHVTLLHIACGDVVAWQHALNHDRAYFESTEFSDKCRNLETRILTRCAGLVEVEERQKGSPYGISRIIRGPNDTIKESRASVSQRLSEYSRDVKFIHKTALEFLETRHATFCHELDWRIAPTLALARGLLVVAITIPKAIPQDWAGSEVIIFYRFIPFVMALVVGSAETVTATKTAWFSHNLSPEVVDQIFEIISYDDMTLHFAEDSRSGIPIENILSNESEFKNLQLCRLPFQDCQGFAAFYGCHDYMIQYLNSHPCSQSKFDYLVTCTLNGVRQKSDFVDHTPLNIGRYTILQELLDRGLDSNSCYNVRSDVWVGNVIEESAWVVFLKSTSRQICLDVPSPGSRSKIDTGDFCLGEYDCDIWEETIMCFLSHGADVDATIYSIYSEVRLDIALEESPWSFLERSLQLNTHRSASSCNFLQPLHAHSRRSWRFIHFLGYDAVEYYPEKARTYRGSEYWYIISQEQSDTLNGKWPRTYRDYSEFTFVIEQIKAGIEKANPATTLDVAIRRCLEYEDDDGL